MFVTGIAGFLGSHIAEHFLRAGSSVSGIDNLLGGNKENVPDGAEFVVADCVNREAYAGLLDGVDLVYHCAAAPWDALSCLLYTSPSPRDRQKSRMPSSA